MKKMNIKMNRKIAVFIGFILLLYIKNLFFIFIGASNDGRSFNGLSIDYTVIIPHLAILCCLAFPGLFFREKGKFIYFTIIDVVYSVFLIADLWIFRASGYFFGIKYIVFPDLFNPLGNSLFNPSLIDLLFIIDISVIIYLLIKRSGKYDNSRYIKTAIMGVLVSLIIIFGWHYLFDIKRIAGTDIRFIQNDWEASWNPATRVAMRSPIGDFIYDAYTTLQKVNSTTDEEEMDKIDKWLEWNNENLPDNEYKGIAKGKNVVFLQIEALENFVINQSIYGQEITPNMNKLINNGLYFSNVYEQNNAANSIDCDAMVNTGVLTLGDSVTFLTYPEVKFNSLARILNSNGYTTVSTHAERSGDWGWLEAHKAALGFSSSWGINDYKIDEYVGFGLSDRSFYTQYVDKLSTLKEPFYSVIPTLSSHGPFDIKDEYRYLDLPEDLDSNRLGGYFQAIHYADKQIGLFIDMLEEKGLMDNTVVVIYGDHGGVHKYYTEDVEESDIPGDWWQEYKRQIPFIVYGKDIPKETIDTVGGHIDIMPTISYLLGVNTDNTAMGRNLLNTNRDASVIKGGIVVGNPTDEEREKLEEAYDIADSIIKNNYYEKRNKVS